VKVVVAMSGGVDSSVAAALLRQQGCDVVGVMMETWSGEFLPLKRESRACYGPGENEDVEDARSVAQSLGIPLHILDLRAEYRSEVLDYFCHEYSSGRTPNPCIRCNRRIKFDALIRKAEVIGIKFDYVATGHYARVQYDKTQRRYLLKRAADLRRDQSYFLACLSQEQLSRCLFPVGNYTKEEVRRMAAHFGLTVGDKLKSRDFIAGGYSPVVRAIAQPGLILDRQGNILGKHCGIPFYTVGQRRGLGISGKLPLYVTAIDPEKNAIIVGSKEEVYGNELLASELNWIAVEKLEGRIQVKAKIRYLHKEAEATVTPVDEDRIHVKFREPQMAITPGQTVVFYNGDTVIGGGTIETFVANRIKEVLSNRVYHLV
jgi:tRNA-specific 2-thiouridylase